MKKLTLILCLSFLGSNGVKAQFLSLDVGQFLISEIVTESYGSMILYKNGAIDRIDKVKLQNGNEADFSEGTYGYQGVPQVSGKGCNDSNLYQKISYGMIESIEDNREIRSDSPLKKLIIRFKGKSGVMKSQTGDCPGNHGNEYVSEMTIVYPDKGDNRKKLIEYLEEMRDNGY